MSITSTKITAASVLKGSAPAEALPVISKDFNKVVDDLTNIDTRLTDLEDGTVDLTDLNVSDNLTVGGATEVETLQVNSTSIFDRRVTFNHVASVMNTTATATAAQISTGYITSTSAAAVAITFPTAASLFSQVGAAVGGSFELYVDNSAGANTITMTPSATITAATAVVTGGDTLTIASGATGIFKIYFPSATTAKVYRIG